MVKTRKLAAAIARQPRQIEISAATPTMPNTWRAPRRRRIARPAQCELFKPRGGARPGAGRPPKGSRSSERHETRPPVRAHQPVHVTLRCAAAVGRLRKRDIYLAIRRATIAMKRHPECRIVHASIQGNHLHLIVEATDRMKRARGMQAFQISAAQRINRAISTRTGVRRKGNVFPDRYHATILTSPRQVRHTLSYVLNNWRRHGEDAAGIARGWTMDPFSTGVLFDGWKEREGEHRMPTLPPTYRPLIVRSATSWLLTTGWRRHGLISVAEVPKGKPFARRR